MLGGLYARAVEHSSHITDISISASAAPAPTPPPLRAPATKASKITAFFKPETAEQTAVRREREAREHAEHSEQLQSLAVTAARSKKAREWEHANERMRQCRKRKREEKIAQGHVPGQKRQRVHLLDHDDTPAPDPHLAELSRPRRQFTEDSRKNKKPCGRKRNKTKIEAAARRAPRGNGGLWSPRAILKELHKTNYGTFHRLTEQVIGRWMDQTARAEGTSKWNESVLRMVAAGTGNPGGHSTRCGVLHPYPETRKKINDQLTCLRAAGVVLTLLTIRGLMVSHIQHDAPHLFERTMGDGSHFRCSEAFVRRCLRNTLGWSERRATKAAQKLPANHEQVLEEAFLREAYVIRDYDIPAALRVNTDQTQLVYQQGSGSTWNQRGAKQVATVGQEEKRAFTLIPSISASGKLLPMQAVFHGKTTASCPSPAADRYAEAVALGYVMLPSKTSTYWSTHDTMHALADDIVAPYFEQVKRELGLPESQMSIWKIDCWSLHKSKEFLAWMKKHHPRIIILFPLDVGIQRLLKLSMKRSAHRDIVNEALEQIKAGKQPHEIHRDVTLPTVRIGLWAAPIHDINDPDTIMKAFEMCKVGPWNCSQASLKSPEALTALCNLRTMNPKLHTALTQTDAADAEPDSDEDDDPYQGSDTYDDCDIPLDVVATHLASGGSSIDANFFVDTQGGITQSGTAEGSEAEDDEVEPVALGRGRRVKTAARRYAGPSWEEH
ncbi:hypothetical protein B0H16DRAFT_1886880 [Mycena metata]|uniref:DDE-1 domain-containing protein n=1 Tax=Mycena metata TaxID=1033252 RepID=A0AAD7NAQ1_9AGAR|nr:hypothetical protein B0H16DRAFT_1886880 [Mycena metata]